MRCALKLKKSPTERAADPQKESSGPGLERRRRKRAKLSSPVRVGLLNSPAASQEVCKTVDVSRDGILFLCSHSRYMVGQRLEVTFPYSTAPSALNQPQPADVVRVFESGAGLFGVAVQFAPATASAKASAHQAEHASPSAIVLLVESDSRAAGRLRDSLQREGYAAIVVATAQAALDVLKTTIPVVFVAPEHSDIDGHDLCVIVRRNDRLQHVPVILLTQSAQPADPSTQQLGAVVSIERASSPDRLVQMIRLLAPPPRKTTAYGAPVRKDLERSL